MNDFLDIYLQLSNKNQHIIISLGRLLSDNIFDRNLTKKRIENILHYLNKNFKLKKKYYRENIHQKANEELKKTENDFTYTIFNDLDYCINDNNLLKWRNYSTDNVILPSYSEFDNIIKREVMEYYINNFKCKIIIENYSYYLNIVIFKPTEKEKVLEFIEIINNI